MPFVILNNKNTASVLTAAFCFMVLSLSGCTPRDTVRLIYTPATPAVIPAPSAPQIAVVTFEDKRAVRDHLGEKRNGTPFTANSPAPEWVSRSLADELSRMGPQVSYAPTLMLAQAARPDFIVTGSLDQVWLQETGISNYTCNIRITVSLANRSGNVFTQTLTSTQEKLVLPKANNVENILADTLREVLGVAASKLSEAAR